MAETLANGYSYESAQRELSNEYKHDRVKMIFIFSLHFLHWMKGENTTFDDCKRDATSFHSLSTAWVSDTIFSLAFFRSNFSFLDFMMSSSILSFQDFCCSPSSFFVMKPPKCSAATSFAENGKVLNKIYPIHNV